ncbi:MAG: hypothetical protein AB1696_25640 [Planctomycetota bacterium]
MKKALVMGLVMAFCCGVVLAGGGSKVVDFEGEKMPAAQADKLVKQGYHRYFDQWHTHNHVALQTEIDCLNLLNSLYLSDVQMRHMIGVGVKMEKGRQKAQPQIEAINKEMEAALRQVKKDVVAGKDKTQSAGWAKVQECEKKLSEIRKELAHQELVCEAYAKAILTPNQREKCYNYQHCLIPVKDLKDPTRVGSADAGSVAEKLLDSIRPLSADELEGRMPMILSKHLAGMEKYMGELSDADRKKEEAKLRSVFAEARAMTDMDYQIQKSRLGAQIPCDYMELKSRMFDINCKLLKLEGEKTDGKCTGVVGQMFLKPCIIPILAKRINLLTEWENFDAIDLDKVKAAAACANGSCAID